MPSTVRPSFTIAAVTIGQNYCELCDRVTTHYGADCVRCCEPEPRALPMLPREDGLGFGLHATTPPAWRVDWWAVLRAGIVVLCCGVWVLAGYGFYRWIAG